MSSADSCILSASSMFTHNIYKAIVCPSASGPHLMIALRVSILAVAAIASVLAISINSIYGLSLLCSDMVYVLLFPQLLLVIHAESSCNKYGCITSFLFGIILRILSGEELLGLPVVIQFPFYSDGRQQMPFRTLIMVLTLFVHLGVSFVTEQCFTRGWLPQKFDFLNSYPLEMTYQQEDISPEELHFQFMSNGKLEAKVQELELTGMDIKFDPVLNVSHPKVKSSSVQTSIDDSSSLMILILTNPSPGLMFVMGRFWQEQRRFTIIHLRDLGFGKTSIEDQMTDELGDLIKDIENGNQLDPARIVDLKGIFQVSVINILWAIIAGERFQRNDPKFLQLLRTNEMMFRAGNPVRGNIPIPAFVLKHCRMAREFIGIKSELIRPFQKFVQETIDDHQQQNPSEGEARDFIDVYLTEMNKQKMENASTNFTNKQLIATITEMFGAGAESTSSSIGFAIIHLIRDQQVQQKMQMELDQVCGQFFPTLNHRSSLPYTEAVLMEAQRCSTIAPFAVPHCPVKDTQIQGYTIPKGSVVLLNLDAVLQDAKYWKDPDVFRPERHLNEDGTKVIKSDHFYPFGLGKRMCLGYSLAKNTYFLFTAALIKQFRFEPVPNEPLPSLDPKIGFTLGYEGFKAVVIPRS